ncbi:AMP-binding protein [Pseudomonas syringae]|uniref:AMP-binding protein n=1 Tax=Pseudomonas syringae TaxID=317 RepID=A0A9Q3ZVC3_PSESX|nr:AMP-binding protein [Pseudomonas syringae]MCF5064988.1 AMP-binding protein [Pseudomonas syringae]MCF5076399.1 AMP-binding protein [Pseudomonas syringae]MCF5120230.1 AMP-binding protein [Pseudomonas syringae]MCF5378705.1 AMP-binding protein [Pseudomonas syringae]
MPHTLPQALLHQAQTRGTAIALRYKRLGIWHERRWSELADDLGQLAGALQQRGFTGDDDLLIISQARPEALLLALAAQWLGASVTLLDPERDHRTLLAGLRPRFVVAQDHEALQQVGEDTVVVYLDGRGLSQPQRSGLIAYAELRAQAPAPACAAEPSAVAFVFHAGTSVQLTHAQLLAGARTLIAREQLDRNDEALAARVFAASGQARYLLAPWLLAGFCLNFPEALSTRDTDRRELGPTLVLGTRESYARLEAWARERLPLPGTLSHRLYAWAMRPTASPVRRWLGHWLVRRPLLDVLGMSRLRVPLLVGPALDPQSAAFFGALGIHPGSWQEPSSLHIPLDHSLPHTA